MMRQAARVVCAVALLVTGAAAVELPFGLGGSVSSGSGSVADVLQAKTWYTSNYTFPVWSQKYTVRPIDYKVEASLLLLVALYIFLHLLGKARNQAVAKTWANVAVPMLADEFAVVGKGTEIGASGGEEHLVWNGAGDALLFATGRRGVNSLHAYFELVPYHDPLALLYHFVGDIVAATVSSSARDTLSLHFALPYQSPDNVSGVFAIISKTALRRSRAGRFDLTFTKLAGDAETSARKLDERFVVLSETSDLSDSLLGEQGAKGDAHRDKVGLQIAINGPAKDLLESLILTDLPHERPWNGPVPVEKRTRSLVLTLRAPHNITEARASLALVEAACNLLDAMELGAARLSALTLTKLRKTRAELDKELLDESLKEQREAEKEAREEAKRKADAEKFSKLSEKEQAKRKELEKKRAQRKAGKSMRGRSG
ncbi:hypothetical protein IE81DRAFT_324426 [Ceraceosorus guamensis]|uniref:DUF1682-domain-containing protein n=1 Tax=Ceraceosorus guamensis TaxID=1522189 RepID=A0A316VVT3_9BASI|nr:hypothetical protein IE81DRAFT_324426 [Ceraceosorus guamensis]PWN41569.1 hypothetical protein IE81DRAFT_324426 [Ceraceosorus guamensis]